MAIHMEYKLMPSEIEEALLALDHRIEGKTRKAVLISLMVIAFFNVFMFWRTPTNMVYVMGAAAAIMTYIAIAIYRPAKRRRQAEKMGSVQGVYKITLYEEGSVEGYRQEKVAFDKRTKAFETGHVFVLRPFGKLTFCIPKRALSPQVQDQVREILRKTVPAFRQIETGPLEK